MPDAPQPLTRAPVAPIFEPAGTLTTGIAPGNLTPTDLQRL
ncbi:MAG: hypothetical protein WEB63_00245 [Cucumibacter sp.]